MDEHGLHRFAPSPPPHGPRSVAEVLDATVRSEPHRTALIDDDASLSYAELDAAVNRASGAFRTFGVGSGDRVVVSLPNGNAIVIAFLALMRLGAIYVGMSTAMTPPEQQQLVADCGARLVLGEEAHRGLPGVEVVTADGEWAGAVAEAGADRIDITVDPCAPAAIAYTSGTTGRPKGAVHSQHNMVLVASEWGGAGRVLPGSRQGVVLPLTILNLQILGPVVSLANGATCLPMRRLTAEAIAARVRRDGIERVAVPPTIAYDLIARPDIDPDDLRTLTDLGVGGASAPPGLAERYRTRFGRLFGTSYGLTEAPTAVTYDDRADRPMTSSGLPLGHVEVSLRDDGGAAVPPGAEGEIVISPRRTGPFAGCWSPMLGYWDQPEATAKAIDADGNLHTGDVARLLADGSLEVVGRRNDLIVRGGANIYPAEVERVLAQHPDVAESVVVGLPDERLGEVVVAAVRRRDGAMLEESALLELLTANLSRYKVPSRIAFVDDFPRNPMGKVVRPELRRLLGGAP